jgi:hypothetical protein
VTALEDTTRAAPPQLDFAVEQAGVHERAVVPTLRFALRIERTAGAPVRSAALNVQVRIAAPRRPYDEDERTRLRSIFGDAQQWQEGGLRSLLWTTASVVAGPFERATVVELAVPCTYDFEVAAAQYLHALRDGTIPLELLFSGTVFHATPNGLQVALLPWDREASYALPASVWHKAMERHFPGAAWLRLDGATFERLRAYRAERALPTWEAAIGELLEGRA